MLIIVSIVLLFLFNIGVASDANEKSDDPTVFAIKISGNQVTSKDFILREMSTKVGDKVDNKKIRRDILWLTSLGLFNRVEISTASDKGRAVVHVTVYEPFYLYFIPLLEYSTSKPDKTTWGGMVLYRNAFGKGQRVSIVGKTGFNQGFSISFRDPWFGFGKYNSFSGYFIHDDSEFKGPEGVLYRAKQSEVGLEFRKRLSETSWAGSEITYEEKTSKEDFYIYSNGKIDKLFVFRLNYSLNKRDYWYYPSSGYLLRVSVGFNTFTNKSHQFLMEQIDFRKYSSLRSMIIAFRFWGESSQGQLPYYRRSSLSSAHIRANHDYGTGGWMSLSSNLEFRFNLMKKIYFDWSDIPYFGIYLRQMPFSIEGVVFGDTGYTKYSSGGDVVRTNLSAWGGGLQFQLPFVNVIHVLGAWGPKDKLTKPTVSFGLGVTF